MKYLALIIAVVLTGCGPTGRTRTSVSVSQEAWKLHPMLGEYACDIGTAIFLAAGNGCTYSLRLAPTSPAGDPERFDADGTVPFLDSPKIIAFQANGAMVSVRKDLDRTIIRIEHDYPQTTGVRVAVCQRSK